MMDTNERTVLRNYLQCFESRKKGHKPRTLILLDLLEKYPDDSRVQELMRKKVPTEDARRMILARLLDKMLATLTLDVNLSRPESYDDVARARAQVAQGKIAASILIARGQRATGLRELRQHITLALRFELFNELVELQQLLMQYSDERKDARAMAGMAEELKRHCDRRDAEMRARLAFDEVVRTYGFKGLSRAQPEQGRINAVDGHAKALEEAYASTGAATVGYFALMLRVEWHQLNGDLSMASPLLQQLTELVENSPSIRNRTRLATAYANLGANELWMHHFDEADTHFARSQEQLRANSRNHALIAEYRFYCQFYAGKMTEAKATLKYLTETPSIDQGAFRKAVRSYLSACVEFCLGNHAAVRRLLAKSHAIGSDREGWNIGSRILSIMNTIERDDLDHADALIANLRQFVREGLRDNPVRRRDMLITEVLVNLRKQSYDFRAVSGSKAEALRELASPTGETAWNVQTPELVCFHRWFAARAGDRPFRASYRREELYTQG